MDARYAMTYFMNALYRAWRIFGLFVNSSSCWSSTLSGDFVVFERRRLNDERSSWGQCRRVVDGMVVVQAFSHQSQRQLVAHAARLLVAGSSVLEPDLDGADVQMESVCQLTSTVVVDVPAAVVLGTQLPQLVGRERGPTTTTSNITPSDRSTTYPRSYTHGAPIKSKPLLIY